MKKLRTFCLVASAVVVSACTTNPLTGRKSLQSGLLDGQLNAMALQQYNTTLQSAKVLKTGTSVDQVKKVGSRIKAASEQYYASIGRNQALQNYAWEFNVIDDKQKNAWCMPGGKVAVYTGILPITKDDTGMAVVLGHEVAHALAGHGNERITQAMMAQYGGAILGSTISNAQMAQIFQQAYPIGAQVVMLKYGRSQELDADQMGLYLMAMAGYDPRQSIPFWERMSSVETNSARPPEFLSTHPNPENRTADLQRYMPKALEYYKAAGGKL